MILAHPIDPNHGATHSSRPHTSQMAQPTPNLRLSGGKVDLSWVNEPVVVKGDCDRRFEDGGSLIVVDLNPLIEGFEKEMQTEVASVVELKLTNFKTVEAA